MFFDGFSGTADSQQNIGSGIDMVGGLEDSWTQVGYMPFGASSGLHSQQPFYSPRLSSIGCSCVKLLIDPNV